MRLELERELSCEPMGDFQVVADRLTLAERTLKYAAPTWVLFRALTEDRERWLDLRDREVVPELLVADQGGRVVWSSLWPAAPEDHIEFELRPTGQATAQRAAGTGTELRFTWTSVTPPDARGIGKVRYRLNHLVGAVLRGWADGGGFRQ